MKRKNEEVLIGKGGKNIKVKERIDEMKIKRKEKEVKIGEGIGIMRIMDLRKERMNGRRYNCIKDRFKVRDKRKKEKFQIRLKDELKERL